MSKKQYIERDAALQVVADNNYSKDITLKRYDSIIEGIYNIPAADVVKVVRCGECKQYEPEGYPEGAGRCGWIDSVVEKDFYCAAGEKKERNV